MATLGDVSSYLRQRRAIGKPVTAADKRAAWSAYFDVQSNKSLNRRRLALEQARIDAQKEQFDKNYESQQERYDTRDQQWRQAFESQQNRYDTSDDQWRQSFESQQDRYGVRDEQWQQAFDSQQNQYQRDLALRQKAIDDAEGAAKISGITQLGLLGAKAADTKIGGQILGGLKNIGSKAISGFGGSTSALPGPGTYGTGMGAGQVGGSASALPGPGTYGTGMGAGQVGGQGGQAVSKLGTAAQAAPFLALAGYNLSKIYNAMTSDKPALSFLAGDTNTYMARNSTPGRDAYEQGLPTHEPGPVPNWWQGGLKSSKYDYKINTKDLDPKMAEWAIGQMDTRFDALSATGMDVNKVLGNTSFGNRYRTDKAELGTVVDTMFNDVQRNFNAPAPVAQPGNPGPFLGGRP